MDKESDPDKISFKAIVVIFIIALIVCFLFGYLTDVNQIVKAD